MLAHDGVNFIDGDMFAHGLGQPIKLAGFIAGILQGAVQRRQPFALAQAVEQRPGKGIAVEQAMEIGAERQAVVAYRPVVYCLPRFMQLQQQISAERLQEKVGREILVLVDEVDEEGAIGRSMADAPEIDGAVYLNGETRVKPGDVVRVKVEHADEYDLWGTRV